jgi:hypothetical protein
LEHTLYIKYLFLILFARAIKHHTQTYLQIKYSNFIFFVKFVFNFLKIIPYFFIFKNSKYLKYKIDNLINQNPNIYRSIVKIGPSTILTLIYYIYVFTISQDIVEIYLSSFLFLTGVFIKLIKITNYWVNNNELKKDFPVFHSIIKYTLFVLLIINSLILIIIGQKLLILILTYLKNLFINMDIKNKLKDLKLSLDYKWVKNKGNKPKDGNFIFDLQNKKKNKKRASFLKEKLLDTQKRNLNKDFTFKQESFSKRRNWDKSINIEDNPKFTIREQLDNVKSEFKAYDKQENKFKKIVVDINKEKENFFPNESRFLFNEYVSVIKILKKNLKSVEKVLSKKKS